MPVAGPYWRTTRGRTLALRVEEPDLDYRVPVLDLSKVLRRSTTVRTLAGTCLLAFIVPVY